VIWSNRTLRPRRSWRRVVTISKISHFDLAAVARM